MDIPKAKDLKYVPVDTTGWPDSLICHCCGKKMPQVEDGCFMSQIEIAADATVDFHFCSAFCKNSFKGHGYADAMIVDIVRKSLKLNKGK